MSKVHEKPAPCKIKIKYVFKKRNLFCWLWGSDSHTHHSHHITTYHLSVKFPTQVPHHFQLPTSCELPCIMSLPFPVNIVISFYWLDRTSFWERGKKMKPNSSPTSKKQLPGCCLEEAFQLPDNETHCYNIIIIQFTIKYITVKV